MTGHVTKLKKCQPGDLIINLSHRNRWMGTNKIGKVISHTNKRTRVSYFWNGWGDGGHYDSDKFVFVFHSKIPHEVLEWAASP